MGRGNKNRGGNNGYKPPHSKKKQKSDEDYYREFVRETLNTTASAAQHFSLQDEARHTGSAFRGFSTNLRHKGISFVKGNMLVTEEEERVEIEVEPRLEEEAEPAAFMVDLVGDSSLVTPAVPTPPDAQLQGHSMRKLERQTSVSSTSSEEIVFKGRARPVVVQDDPTLPPSKSTPPPAVSAKPKVSIQPEEASKAEAKPFEAFATPQKSKNRRKKDKLARQRAESAPENNPSEDHDDDDDERAILEDYLANLQAQGDMGDDNLAEQSAFLLKDMSLEDDNAWKPKIATSPLVPGKSTIVDDSSDWDETELLEAFENASTSQGMDAVVEKILYKRTRPSGIQYLVAYEGFTADDARWLPKASLESVCDALLVKNFEDGWEAKTIREKLQAEADEEDWEDEDDEDEEGEDSSEDDEDEIEEAIDIIDMDDDDEDEDDDDDDIDLIQRRIERMSDEKIARLLAKQEELGFGADEIMLFDGMDEEDMMDLADLRQDTFQPKRVKGRRAKNPKKNKEKTFPSATLMADVIEQDPYNGFDIMDFDRPSLKPKTNGRKGKLPFELEDKELEEELVDHWAADRSKKAQKKAQRAELRAQGLLGKKSKPSKDGITMAELRDELQKFLNSDSQQWALPPMAKHYRGQVHQIVRVFKIHSQSQGSGHSRFTTLYKNALTLPFDIITWRRVEKRINIDFFPDPSATKLQKSARKGGKGGGGTASASYRDGDVVGFGAAELGVENKGRAMLEKMGWSSGMALGAINNKGILLPVSHVVKTSKAGLG